MTTDTSDVKSALTEGLTELHLPTVKRVYEEAARLAERETLSYERYLLNLVTRETHDRQQKRIQRLLRQSRIPAEKAFANWLTPILTRWIPQARALHLCPDARFKASHAE